MMQLLQWRHQTVVLVRLKLVITPMMMMMMTMMTRNIIIIIVSRSININKDMHLWLLLIVSLFMLLSQRALPAQPPLPCSILLKGNSSGSRCSWTGICSCCAKHGVLLNFLFLFGVVVIVVGVGGFGQLWCSGAATGQINVEDGG